MKIVFLNILAGLAIAAIGIAISVGSYAAVSKSGGHYVVAWGAIAVGVWRVMVGLYQLARAAVTAEGRAAIGHFLWPARRSGRLVRLAILVVAAAAVYLVGPESWTSFAPAPLLTYEARGAIESIAYSPDGRWIAMGLSFGNVTVIDARTGTLGATIEAVGYDPLEAIAFSPDGTRLAAIFQNSGLQIWTSADWGQPNPTLVWRAKEGNHARFGLAFSPDGRSLATGSDSGLLVWDVERHALKWSSKTGGSVHSVAVSTNGRMVASGDINDVQVWDAASGKLVRTLRVSVGYLTVTSILFLRDGRIAAVSGHEVSIWDVANGNLVQTLRSTPRPWRTGSDVWAIAAAPNDRWIAGALSDGSLRVWDMASDKPSRSFFLGDLSVRSVAVSPDGARVAGGSSDVLKVFASP